IVGPVNTRLHQHGTSAPERSKHAAILRQERVGRRVDALRDVFVNALGSADMGVTVASEWRQFEFGLTGMGIGRRADGDVLIGKRVRHVMLPAACSAWSRVAILRFKSRTDPERQSPQTNEACCGGDQTPASSLGARSCAPPEG